MDAPELLPTVEISPAEARSAVIWLHGLGADGHDFEPIVPYLGLPAEARVRFVFPHAPTRAVTINMGMRMPSWYDISELDLERKHDEKGIFESCGQVRRLIERENERGIPSDRIVLAGFSQGGAIALHLALRHPERLAGVLALSTYLVRAETLPREASDANREIPIFQAHGSEDPMVPFAAGETARKTLEAGGYPVIWKTYRMGHEVSPAEIRDVGTWLYERLGEPSGR